MSNKIKFYGDQTLLNHDFYSFSRAHLRCNSCCPSKGKIESTLFSISYSYISLFHNGLQLHLTELIISFGAVGVLGGKEIGYRVCFFFHLYSNQTDRVQHLAKSDFIFLLNHSLPSIYL